MKKMMSVFGVVAVSAIFVVGLSSFVSTTQTSVEKGVHVEGYGDGHCTKCGLKNGKYCCPSFIPTNAHSSVCCCGHSKSSHAYR